MSVQSCPEAKTRRPSFSVKSSQSTRWLWTQRWASAAFSSADANDSSPRFAHDGTVINGPAVAPLEESSLDE